MQRVERVTRWLIVLILLVLLIEFPRDTSFSLQAYTDNVNAFAHRWLTLSLGNTVDGRPILQMIEGALPSTLQLLAVAVVFVLVFGVAKGIIDGLQVRSGRRGRLVSNSIQWFAESIPDFFIIFALEVFGFYLGRHGFRVYFVGSSAFISGLMVPAAVLSLVPTMYLARLVRITVEDQFGQQYLVTAQAKGLTRRRVILSHILPNCLGTVARGVAPVIGMLISNLVVVEYLLYRPGVVAGLFRAMGNSGGEPMYGATGTPAYPYDPNLCFAYTLTAGILYLVLWALVHGVLRGMGYKGQVNPYSSTLRDRDDNRFPWQLIVGACMLFLMVVTGALGDRLGLPDPNSRDLIRFVQGGILTPPFPPSAHHLLGTDLYGRDMLSRVIHDTLPTFEMIVVTLACVVTLAATSAILSSILGFRPIRFLINTANTYFTLIPGVVSALYVLEFPLVYFVGGNRHGLIYLSVLCVIEWFRVAYQLQTVLDEEAQKSYMESAEISGNSAWTRFILYHAGPLRRAVIEQTVVGFSRLLMLIATLGFFHISYTTQQPPMFIDDARITSADWGGLFAENSRDVMGYHWVLFAPALFVAWTVVSLNFLQKGIQITQSSVPRRAAKRQRFAFRVIGLLTRKRSEAGSTAAHVVNPS